MYIITMLYVGIIYIIILLYCFSFCCLRNQGFEISKVIYTILFEEVKFLSNCDYMENVTKIIQSYLK